MKGYATSEGYMGFVQGRYMLFASEVDYREYMEDQIMKEQYITITGIKHYYGIIPFEIGRKITCVKEPDNYYDQEAIRCQVKHIGTVGYVANSTYTVAVGTKSAGRIAHKVKKKFKVQVMFVAGNYVICKVVEGLKEKKEHEPLPEKEEETLSFNQITWIMM